MRRRSHCIIEKFCSQAKGGRKIDMFKQHLFTLIILRLNPENDKEQQKSEHTTFPQPSLFLIVVSYAFSFS